MTPDNAANTYRNATFESAPPLKIVRMMYGGALRFLQRANLADPSDTRAFNGSLQRADAVVSELRCSLDHERGGEIAAQLDGLYLFVGQQIGEAMLGRTKAPILAAIGILETLLDGWNRVQSPTEQAA